jgi:hypothetical protein
MQFGRAGGVRPRICDDFAILNPDIFDDAINAVGGIVDGAVGDLEQ